MNPERHPYDEPFTVVIQRRGGPLEHYHIWALTIKRAVEQAKAKYCPSFDKDMHCFAAAGHHDLDKVIIPEARGWPGLSIDGIIIDESYLLDK